jgi:hypothetical protein
MTERRLPNPADLFRENQDYRVRKGHWSQLARRWRMGRDDDDDDDPPPAVPAELPRPPLPNLEGAAQAA